MLEHHRSLTSMVGRPQASMSRSGRHPHRSAEYAVDHAGELDVAFAVYGLDDPHLMGHLTFKAML